MYPIEREDYVNAYIGAMTEEMQRSGFAKSTSPEPTGSFDRFTKVIAGKLSGWHHRTRGTTTPLSTA